MSQGPGWWVASDNKWYPPESHPEAVAIRAAQAELKMVGTSPTESDRTPASPIQSSPRRESPPAIGNTPAIGSTPAIQSTPTVPPPVFNEGETPWSVSSVAPKRAKGPWVVGVVVIVALAVAALVVALSSGSSSSTFTDGASAVAFQISAPGGGRPFSGTVGSKNLSGMVVEGASFGGPQVGSSSIPFFSYEGHLDSTAYVLHVSLKEQTSQTAPQQVGLAFEITGTYGREPVKASASFNLGSLIGSSETVSFTGLVGSQPLHGEATATMQKGGGVSIRGTVNAVPKA